MPTKRVETSLFVLFVYERKTEHDFEQLRTEVEPVTNDKANKRDIILDFSSCKTTTTPEISLVTGLIQSVKGTSRNLRLVPNVDMTRKLEILRLDKSPNLIIYKDRRTFLSAYTGDRLSH